MGAFSRDKTGNGACPPPPAYHETAAYPRSLQTPRRLRKVFSVRGGVALLVAVQLSWMYLWAARNEPAPSSLSALAHQQFEAGLASCAAINTFPSRIALSDRKDNPRWNPGRGQTGTTILRNATLFDGEEFLDEPVDIVFSKGLIVSVSPSGGSVGASVPGATEYDLHGAHVTPGLVDMHSHHLVTSWPSLRSTEDSNEMYGGLGPITPFLRALDSMKAYDIATTRIASGGVTSSLIIPGSANIMGGEGALVKNVLKAGPHGEYVVEEMLLEHGIDAAERKRYMKMACGENPKQLYKHTRMGNAWLLREWLGRAQEMLKKQDAWCQAAQAASTLRQTAALLAEKGGFPQELELDSTVGMLRGRVAMHNHCYEPEDLETMLRISHEFGFRVRAFHHAIAAWQVPEMLKEQGENVTVATFAEFALYKQEAYAASLAAGKILNDHGIPVAYKSDHGEGDTSAQYLLLQSAVGHSYGLPADKALQAVTSVPAKSLEIDDRVGYVRSGYDADVVVWDSHPLSIGATPRQVFIDGVATLDPRQVDESMAHVVVQAGGNEHRGAEKPSMRATISPEPRQDFCTKAQEPGRAFIISGISKSFVDEAGGEVLPSGGDTKLVIDDGKVTCIGPSASNSCDSAERQLYEVYDRDNIVTLRLQDGHVTRGLVAITSVLGMAEIATDPATGDGVANTVSPRDSANNVNYAKYGVRLGKGKAFARARLGGVTRAVQAPMTEGGLITGVSTGMRTSAQSNLLNGGLFQDDVAMHVSLGADAKENEGTVSMGIQRLRALLHTGLTEEDSLPWVSVANGSLPLVIKADSTHDIQQVILLQRDFAQVRTVILAGREAPLLAREIAEAKIPVITTAVHTSPDRWDARESLPGPPLSRSTSDVLREAGVLYGVAINTDGGKSYLFSFFFFLCFAE